MTPRTERAILKLDRVPRLSLRPEEAAAAIGISRSTLDEWTKGGRVPHFRHGSVVLYPVKKLSEWLHDEVNLQNDVR